MSTAPGAGGLEPGDPQSIGPFRVVARLGAGGMGHVFYALSPGGRAVAVKVIRPELAQDPHFRDRFAREVAAARTVNAFYTAPFVDADPDADPPWLATAFIDGPTLHQAVTATGAKHGQALWSLAAGLAEGLAAVHDVGLVHRDLKPGNVILADDGPRIIDFGIARPLDATTLTTAGMLLGTPMFMSPEQMLLQRPGPASDVFALGAVLVFAATGRPPFGTGTFHELRERILSEGPGLTGVPASLTPLLANCLAKQPDARPTAVDVLAALPAKEGATEPGRRPVPSTAMVPLPPPVAEARTTTSGSTTLTGTFGDRVKAFGDFFMSRGFPVGGIVGVGYSLNQMSIHHPLWDYPGFAKFNSLTEILVGFGISAVAGMLLGSIGGLVKAAFFSVSDNVVIDAKKMSVTCSVGLSILGMDVTTFTVEWSTLERLEIHGATDDARLFAWFKPSRQPSPEWLAKHKVERIPQGMNGVTSEGGYVLYPPLTDRLAVHAWELNEPLTRYASHLYTDSRLVNDRESARRACIGPKHPGGYDGVDDRIVESADDSGK